MCALGAEAGGLEYKPDIALHTHHATLESSKENRHPEK